MKIKSFDARNINKIGQCAGFSSNARAPAILNINFAWPYADGITITWYGSTSIIGFRDTAHKILLERLVNDMVTDGQNQSDRIIDMADGV